MAKMCAIAFPKRTLTIPLSAQAEGAEVEKSVKKATNEASQQLEGKQELKNGKITGDIEINQLGKQKGQDNKIHASKIPSDIHETRVVGGPGTSNNGEL